MEDEIGLSKALNTYEELKETTQLYYNCLNKDKMKLLVSPLLKYALYNLNLFDAFNDRLKSMNIEIEKLKENLKNYKGKKIDANEEMKKLDGISCKLITIEKQANKEYDYYKVYLVEVAKQFDKLKNDIAKTIYIKTSEDIIISRIIYYLNYEKIFIIFNDIFKQLSTIF